MELDSVSFDAGGRVRVGQLTTLGDNKILNEDDVLLTENTGTGTGLFVNNNYLMTVASGQYQIKTSKRYYPYFAGKSQQFEETFINFKSQSGVIKRVGYFSSNAVAPYDTDYDGFYLESVDDHIFLCVSRQGSGKLRIIDYDFDNYAAIRNYDWSKFTVILFDFLWLGGAVLRLFVKTEEGFVLVHTYNYSGTNPETFTRSPNHKIRYEIRSTGGSGSLTYVCNQVSTEGSISESGKQRAVDTGSTAISLATIGTTYPLISIRKNVLHRDRMVKAIGLNAYVSSVNDLLLVSFLLNPTLSAPLTYQSVSNSYSQYAVGNGIITATNEGTKIWSSIIPFGVLLQNNILNDDYLSSIGVKLDNTSDELVLAGTPLTGGISTYASIHYKDF